MKTRLLTRFAILIAVCAAFFPVWAQNKPVPPNGAPLLPVDNLALFAGNGGLVVTPFVDAVQGKALRLAATTRAENPWNQQIGTAAQGEVKQGDVLLASFWARSVSGGSVESGQGTLGFVFEIGREPYTKSAEVDIEIPRTWKRYDIPFTAHMDFPKGDAKINFRVGYSVQTLEIAKISVVNYGTTVKKEDLPTLQITYAGREPGAAWRKAALARIEKIRKGDMAVTVLDKNRKPVPNATVEVRMVRHAFPFGSAVAADALFQPGADGDKYRDFITKNFNRVVLENDLKWPVTADNGLAPALKAIEYLHGKNIEVRGHNLIWPSWRNSPAKIQALKNDKTALAKAIDDHFRETVTATKGKLVEWDVVNEPFDNHDITDILGRDALVHWFKLARQYDSRPTLFLNDYPPLDGSATANKHLESFYDNIQYLKRSGAPLGGIGFQGHIGSNVIPPAQVVSGLDRFAALGLPIAITEFDIKVTDEQLQADYMRDFMTAAFSQPACESIIMWGFWEGRHWIPEAALLRRDWSVKPVGKAWLDLVQGQWKTNVRGKTGAAGTFSTRAFYGDYEIVVNAGGKSVRRTAKLLPKVGKLMETIVLD